MKLANGLEELTYCYQKHTSPRAERHTMKNRLFEDEDNNIISITTLALDYNIARQYHETEAETFEDYIANCTDKNGTLIEMTKEKVKEYQREEMLQNHFNEFYHS